MARFLVEIHDADDDDQPLGCLNWLLFCLLIIAGIGIAMVSGGVGIVAVIAGVFAIRLLIRFLFKK